MYIRVQGVVNDHFGDVLLKQRDETGTLAPPGGPLRRDETPDETAAREVREQTGLIVMPVRLAGLYYAAGSPAPVLTLSFRCIMRGGTITEAESGQRQAGFFKRQALPEPMMADDIEIVQETALHAGGRPFWRSHPESTVRRIQSFLEQRVLRRAPQETMPDGEMWRVWVTLVMQREEGVLWMQRHGSDVWQLPVAPVGNDEPPWVTAARVIEGDTAMDAVVEDLSGMYLTAGETAATFTFVAAAPALVHRTATAKFEYFPAGAEPTEAVAAHVKQVADAVNPREAPRFEIQSR